ncbi:MAG: ACP S-malonyltransferase [Eubacteriaceae bacterium]|nr:ACP S-malonyltransferase [Eubacteriaceae bacterium]
MKTGIVFAGQGAQYPGMGKDLYDNSAEAKKVFDEAGDQVKDWCFYGTKEMLRQTHITQPSIYTVTMAAYRALREALAVHPELAPVMEITGYAGFSLGEYAALTAAGAITDMAAGQYIVTKRGNLMNEAGKDAEGNQRGGMAAGFGKRETICEVVDAARGDRILEAVNFNSPVQTVVAGEHEALDRFVEMAKEKRVKAKMLSVSTAFHSPLMIPAAKELKKLLLDAGLKAPDHKIYSNVTGRDMMENFDGGDAGAYISDIMSRQAMSPVYWQETVENMIGDGVKVLIEVGPGKTLSGLAKKISKELITLHVEDHESLKKTINELEEILKTEEEEN